MEARSHTGSVSHCQVIVLLQEASVTDCRLDVDSRSGSLYCQMCDDFVWDPTLEDLRMRKIGTGSFSSK